MAISSDLASFQRHLCSSRKILALVGAGLSASSGLPTFRGAGGLWGEYDASELATPDAFQTNPSLVWQFYSTRRAAALKAKPNKGHYALAELARRKGDDFLTLTQNVDGLSKRADHPPGHLLHLHGDLFTVKCTSFMCNYKQDNNYDHPLTPALQHCEDLTRLSDPEIGIIPDDELPICPSCRNGLLRPGVVWYGETLPLRTVDMADQFVQSGQVDLILVIGTSGTVWPAASYVQQVTRRGGKVAVFNIEEPDELDYNGSPPSSAEGEEDVNGWVFLGDAAEILPKALEPLIGKVRTSKYNY